MLDELFIMHRFSTGKISTLFNNWVKSIALLNQAFQALPPLPPLPTLLKVKSPAS